jgi:ribosome-associated toxin RatA of RatAB toxin-antitoxin module
MDSVKRLFEYYCSLILVEKRFFNLQSQCNYIYFTWYDCINGIQSTQKSIQYEKASVLFNCAALYSQIAAIRQNGKENLLNEQKLHWQLAAGCLKYLNVNFSNSPSLDMSNQVLDLFIETFISQAYESLAKSFIKESKIKQFSNFISVSKIYAHVSFAI